MFRGRRKTDMLRRKYFIKVKILLKYSIYLQVRS